MDLNKDDFFNLLNLKEYVSCISMLREEIISNLTSRVKEHDSKFEYSSLSNLKTACFKYLGYDEQHTACILYDLDNMHKPYEDEISQLMELYKTLIDINK